MPASMCPFFLAAALVWTAWQPARAAPLPTPNGRTPPAAHTDRYGDPLPPRAVARLGTVRLRHSGKVRALAFTSDGRTLLVGVDDYGGSDGANIWRWDVSTGRPAHTTWDEGDERGCFALARSPDGKLLASVHGASVISLWDIATGQLRRTFDPHLDKNDGNTLAVTFSPDGRSLASGGGASAVKIWDVRNGRLRRAFRRGVQVLSLAYAPDGKTVISGGEQLVHAWDANTGKVRWRRPGSVSSPYGLAFSPDGRLLALADGDGAVRLVAPSSGRECWHWQAHDGRVRGVAFSPNGKLLASAGDDWRVCLWEVATGRQLHRLGGHYGAVAALGFSPDGRVLASGGEDDWSVRLWDVATGRERFSAEGHGTEIVSVAIAPDGKTLFSQGNDGVRRWDVAAGRQVWCYPTVVEQIALSPDGRLLAVAGSDGHLTFVDPGTGRPRHDVLVAHTGVDAVAFSPDGRSLASAGAAGDVRLWHAATAEAAGVVERGGGDERVASLCFSPDGRLLAAGGESGTLSVYDAATRRLVRRVKTNGEALRSLAFSPAGALLAVADPSHKVRFWDAATGKELRLVEKEDDRANDIAFSPDGRVLVTGGEDDVVRLWEVASGEPIAAFTGHRDAVNCVAFAPDGRTVVSGSRDRTVLVWDRTGLLRDGRLPQLHLSPQELDTAWRALGGKAAEAEPALWRLVAAGPQAVAWCAERLRPAAAVEGRLLAGLIQQLDAARFQAREDATRRLQALGDRVRPALEGALAQAPSPEARRRLVRLLERPRQPTPQLLRDLRAVAVLEYVGDGRAGAVLRRLAEGDPGAVLTRQAKAAVDRLERKIAVGSGSRR